MTLRGVLRVIGWLAGAALILVVVAAATIWTVAGLRIRKIWDVPLTGLVVPSDSVSVAEGGRLARTRACLGCHGERAQGDTLFHEPAVGTLVAPNLTHAVRTMSDAELERVVRRGVRANGRSVWAMPSDMFYHLSDADLGRILAYLRSLPETEGLEFHLRMGPLARFGVTIGQFTSVASRLDPPPERLVVDSDDPALLGEYLARTSCTECHGPDLLGDETSASLAVAAGYTLSQFRHFFSTGEALGGRELELMSEVARRRFSAFTPDEVAGLHAWASTLAGLSPGGVTESGIAWEARGGGAPIVLVHGSNLDRRVWDPLMPGLVEHFRVIRYDLRAHGRSAAFTTPVSQLDDLLQVLDAAGAPRATIVGLSAGARIALDFALEHPERTTALVLAAPTVSGLQPTERPAGFEALVRRLKAGDSEGAAAILAGMPVMAAPAEYREQVRAMVVENARLFEQDPALETRPEPAIDRLDRLRTPTLVVVGDRDARDIRRAADTVAAVAPGVELVVLPRAGHLLSVWAPDTLAALIRRQAEARGAGGP